MMPTRFFAHVNAFGCERNLIQQLWMDQPVVEHDLRVPQTRQSLNGDQAGIARTGADKIDHS